MHYFVSTDTSRVNQHVNNALKKAVKDGVLVQTKGTGANGSFKLAKVKAKVRSKSITSVLTAE